MVTLSSTYYSFLRAGQHAPLSVAAPSAQPAVSKDTLSSCTGNENDVKAVCKPRILDLSQAHFFKPSKAQRYFPPFTIQNIVERDTVKIFGNPDLKVLIAEKMTLQIAVVARGWDKENRLTCTGLVYLQTKRSLKCLREMIIGFGLSRLDLFLFGGDVFSGKEEENNLSWIQRKTVSLAEQFQSCQVSVSDAYLDIFQTASFLKGVGLEEMSRYYELISLFSCYFTVGITETGAYFVISHSVLGSNTASILKILYKFVNPSSKNELEQIYEQCQKDQALENLIEGCLQKISESSKGDFPHFDTNCTVFAGFRKTASQSLAAAAQINE